MKKTILMSILGFFILSCENNKSENHIGIIEGNDSKSLTMNSFNDAYLANDMVGQEEIFADNAIAKVNGQEMSPAEMIEAFLEGKEFYDEVKNTDRATGTFILDEGEVYTNTWFGWEGVSKSTGIKVANPVHASFKWEGDKVVEVSYVFDSAKYVANMGSSVE